MGHCPRVYTSIDDKKKIISVCEKHTARNCDREENPSGSYSNSLSYLDRIFDTEEECEEYLMDKVLKGFYNDYAARYKMAPKPSAKLTKLQNRLETMRKAMFDYQSAQVPKKTVQKSAYITCKGCGSKLSVQHLSESQSTCPLCRHTLRSNTAIARIKKYEDDIKALEKDIRDEQKKLSAKSTKLLWAVGTDCHC